MILIATCDQFDHPTPSLEKLLVSLRSRGVRVEHKAWKHTDIREYAKADLTIPLCFWDYHGAIQHFLDWVKDVELLGGKIVNSPEVLRWNFRKTYLIELLNENLLVPFTTHIKDINAQKIKEVMQNEGLQSAVVKPVSGQNGHDVIKLDIQDCSNCSDFSYPYKEALVQEYRPEITEFGETTLTFIDGEYSHAIRRILSPNEWRANQQFSIQYELISVPYEVVKSAKAYLDHVPGKAIYARVDGIMDSNRFVLMELELIDPYLYLEFAPAEATEKLVDAIINEI